jgi:hypothetical protein
MMTDWVFVVLFFVFPAAVDPIRQDPQGAEGND